MESNGYEEKVSYECTSSRSEDLEDGKYWIPVNCSSSSEEELQKQVQLEEFRLEEVEAQFFKKYWRALDRGIKTKEGGHEMWHAVQQPVPVQSTMVVHAS